MALELQQPWILLDKRFHSTKREVHLNFRFKKGKGQVT